MKRREKIEGSQQGYNVRGLVERGARQGVTLDRASAESLTRLDCRVARHKLDGVCRLVKAARSQNVELDFGCAMRSVEACGGDPAKAIRRMMAGSVKSGVGIGEFVEYAADLNVTLAPRTVQTLFRKLGRPGARCYVDELGAIMNAADMLGIDCSQTLARRRLSGAQGDAKQVIRDFAATHRRRMDRRTARCQVLVPPREAVARTNALAGCGCPRCCSRLATYLHRYIGKMIASSLFSGLDRHEARAEANRVLIEATETWPGGNFTGWFAKLFEHRVLEIYRARSAGERETVSLDASGVLADDQWGRIVPLDELVSNRTVNVLIIVLIREELAERALELRRQLVERCEEYASHQLAGGQQASRRQISEPCGSAI